MEAHTLRAISKGLSTPPEGSEVTQEMIDAAVRKNRTVSIVEAQTESTSRPRNSQRGFAFAVHQRDKFKCQYCSLDGTQSFAE